MLILVSSWCTNDYSIPQFLFRECHLRKSKSTVAASAAVAMNPQLSGRVHARLERVHEATEDIFSDVFFANTDIVSNALDNIKARLYVDSRCVATYDHHLL